MRWIFLSVFLWSFAYSQAQVLVPIAVKNRNELTDVKLTSIGKFGLPRKARKGVAAHLHVGVDIMRPRDNYVDEPIFPIANGKVISVREDGAYAQIIVEHQLESLTFWSVYDTSQASNVNSEKTFHRRNPLRVL